MKRNEKKLEISYKLIIDFIIQNGKKVDNSYYWEKHPICFYDKCIDGIAVMPFSDNFKIVPYIIVNKEKINPFTNSSLSVEQDLLSLRPKRLIEYRHIEGLLNDLKNYN